MKRIKARWFKTYPRLRIDAKPSDFLAAFLVSFKPDKSSETDLQDFLRSKTGNKHFVVGLSVRTLFDALLKSLQLPKGSEVLLSAATIENMVDIVKAHGLIAVPVDLDLYTLAPSLECAAEFVNGKSKLFVIAPLFGGRLELEPYARFCKNNDLFLIEDLAQAYDGNYYGSSYADFNFLSFGPIKNATAFAGGISLTNLSDKANSINDILFNYLKPSNSWYRQRILKLAFLNMLSNPYAYWLSLKLLSIFGFDVEETIGKSARGFKGDFIDAIKRRPPKAVYSMLLRRLERPSKNNEMALKLKVLLDRKITIPGLKTEGTGNWIFPIMVGNREELMGRLRQNGFDATKGATSMIAISDKERGRSTNAKHLLSNILFLPMTMKDQKSLESMAAIVNRHAEPIDYK